MLKYVIGPDLTAAAWRTVQKGVYTNSFAPEAVFDSIERLIVYYLHNVPYPPSPWGIVPVEVTGTDDEGRINFRQSGRPLVVQLTLTY